MNRFILLSVLGLVAACATPEQLAEQRRQQAAIDTQTCRNYGFRPGTEAFGNCRLQIDLVRQEEQNNYNRAYFYSDFSYARGRPYHYFPH